MVELEHGVSAAGVREPRDFAEEQPSLPRGVHQRSDRAYWKWADMWLGPFPTPRQAEKASDQPGARFEPIGEAA